MYATLILATVLAQPPQPTQPRGLPAQPAQPVQPSATPGIPATPGTAATARSLDGDWQVIALEKDGRPVDGATTFTASVRNNVVTFSGGDEKNRPHTMRMEFGPNGQIRLTEQGTSERPGIGDRPRGTGTADRPAVGSPTTTGAKSGVYIMAGDYLAVSLYDHMASTTPRVQPGGFDTPAPARPATPPAGLPGTAPRPAPPAPLPGTAPPATTPGAGTGFSAAVPTEKPTLCVILKRSTSTRTPGSPGSGSNNR